MKSLLKNIGLLDFVLSCYSFNFIVFLQALRSYIFNRLLTFFPNHYIRNLYLKKIMRIKIGKLSFIHMGVRFEGNISIGEHSVIGRNCVLIGDIDIKNNVSITAETYIFTASHYLDSPMFEAYSKPVVIEDYAWIGARAVILPGVRVGVGSVLGAASTATKSIPDYSVFAGAPAKEIRKRSKKLEYKLVYFPFFQ